MPDQTVVLSVLNDTEVVYIGRRPGSRAVGVNYELGMRLPANCTASGKALLSTLEPDRVRDLYSEFEPDGLPILTKRSINALSALVQELIARAEHDYALDDEETAMGMICVGAPIRGATGKAVAAVAVSTVKAAVSGKERSALTSEVQHLSREISTALGWSGSTPAR